MKNKGYANFGEHAQIRCIILIMGDVQLAYCGVNHEMAQCNTVKTHTKINS